MTAKTQTQTPAPVLSPARAQLQQALEAKQRAQVLVGKAEAVVNAAATAVERAREECAKYDEAGEDIVASRLRVLKGEEPAKSPEQLREARRARLLAKEELTAADETSKAATQELAEAHGNVARSQKVMASHATSVLGESANDAIALWQKVNLERERLRAILGSLVMTPGVHLDAMPAQQQANIIQAAVSQAGLPYGDSLDWVHLQNKVGAALAHNFSPTDPGPSLARARKFWAQFADSLMADPSAEQPPLPGGDALFN